jgi:flagellar basal-body rod protein FlgF
MDSGYYAALTGLVARTQALDTAAANLANAQTPGYRAEREFFRSTLLGPDAQNSQLGRTVNNFGLLGGDLAIEGEGMFEVRTANGLRFTRDGGFHRSSAGQLVTEAGETVLSSAGNAIQLPPGEVTVGSDGAVSVDGGVVSTVGVFTFPTGTQLKPEGANRYLPPEGVKAVLSTKSSIRQSAIEAANQDVIQGSLDLIVMQRQAEMMQKALTIFHTEFNKTATEDLPRI